MQEWAGQDISTQTHTHMQLLHSERLGSMVFSPQHSWQTVE